MLSAATIRVPSCGIRNICYRTLGMRFLLLPKRFLRIAANSVQENNYVTIGWLLCTLLRALRDTLKGVRVYLCGRVDFEPNPYYKGRYQVALSTAVNAYNHLSHPYEVAEVLFRNSRLSGKIDRWLTERCERFPYLVVRFDGSLGGWLQPGQLPSVSLPPKKQPQSVKPETTEGVHDGRKHHKLA